MRKDILLKTLTTEMLANMFAHLGQAGEPVGAVDVHGTGPADALPAEHSFAEG